MQAEVDAFCEWLLNFRSRLDFTPGSRGWCYLLENQGVIGKSDFGRMEYFINERRKDGCLPLDFCANDEKRAPENQEDLDALTPQEYAELVAQQATDSWQQYEPISLWEFQPYYIEVVVEKVDLRELFKSVCAEFHVMIWNAGGWSDINSRADILRRFREHTEEGRSCVLLYCGDFDPAGLHISGQIYQNLKALERAIGWFPDHDHDQLIIDRFGLNIDFIESHDLSWIDGLETGSGKYNLEDRNHPDHDKPYVQTYLKQYGAKKVEANALVAHYEAGRQLCREAIEKYIDLDGIGKYHKRVATQRLEVKKRLPVALKAVLNGDNGRAR
jgi:hypothetical protein